MEDLGAMTLNMTILGERRAAPERVVSFVSSLYGHSQRLSRRPCEQSPKHTTTSKERSRIQEFGQNMQTQ